MIHAFNQNRPPAVIDDSHDARQMIAPGLRLGAGHHLPRGLQSQRLFVEQLRRRALGEKGKGSEGKTRGNDPHRYLLSTFRDFRSNNENVLGPAADHHSERGFTPVSQPRLPAGGYPWRPDRA
jgi:hypothetical protein